jgi:hypothetical protein
MSSQLILNEKKTSPIITKIIKRSIKYEAVTVALNCYCNSGKKNEEKRKKSRNERIEIENCIRYVQFEMANLRVLGNSKSQGPPSFTSEQANNSIDILLICPLRLI